MNDTNRKQLGQTLWGIADQLRGAMNADDFRDYMLSFLFLRYLSDNYEIAAKKELGRDYPVLSTDVLLKTGASTPLQVWYEENKEDIPAFEKQMRRKVHYVSTGIPVCILVLKKCKKPDDVLFINASGPEHFDKGKRQNQLSPKHIAKIIDTYQYRKEEER